MGQMSKYREAFARRLQLAVFLKQLRDNRKIEQQEVADEVTKRRKLKPRLSRAAVSAWYRGEAIPVPETMMVLAEWLDCDPGWFMAGDKTQAPAPELPAKALSMDITMIAGRWRDTPQATKRVPGRRAQR